MPASFREKTVQTQEQGALVAFQLVLKATQHPEVRRAAIKIVSDCDARDDMCELRAIYNAVKSGTSYVAGLENGVKYISDPDGDDPQGNDYYTAPWRLLAECADENACAEDCLPVDTLVVTKGYKLKRIGDVVAGDVIMGDGVWTTVTKFMDKGPQRVLEIELNNGCVLRCTAAHKLFVVPRVRDGNRPGKREDAVEVRAGNIKIGDDLLTAAVLPCGVEKLDSDLAWLYGVYTADGWVDGGGDEEMRRASISGQDGCPKEEQKRRVQRIAEANGWHTRWNRKYIAINNKELAQLLASFGTHAIDKHLPSLEFNKSTIEALLSGLAADADVRDGIFGTISPTLAIQLRLMKRMLGVSCHIKKVETHGGLGKNPIYRVTPRKHTSGPHSRPHAKVKAIREGKIEHTVDIETDTHKFYLPETDLVVHNCDGHAMLVAALAAQLGFQVGLRIWKPKGAQYFEHIYAIVGYPKLDPTHAVAMDTTVPEARVGWEPDDGTVKSIALANQKWINE